MNKAGYKTTPVAFGWAEAVIDRVTRAFGRSGKLKKLKNAKKKVSERPTD